MDNNDDMLAAAAARFINPALDSGIKIFLAGPKEDYIGMAQQALSSYVLLAGSLTGPDGVSLAGAPRGMGQLPAGSDFLLADISDKAGNPVVVCFTGQEHRETYRQLTGAADPVPVFLVPFPDVLITLLSHSRNMLYINPGSQTDLKLDKETANNWLAVPPAR